MEFIWNLGTHILKADSVKTYPFLFGVNIPLGLKALFLRRRSLTWGLGLACILCLISPMTYKLGFPVQVLWNAYWLITNYLQTSLYFKTIENHNPQNWHIFKIWAQLLDHLLRKGENYPQVPPSWGNFNPYPLLSDRFRESTGDLISLAQWVFTFPVQFRNQELT